MKGISVRSETMDTPIAIDIISSLRGVGSGYCAWAWADLVADLQHPQAAAAIAARPEEVCRAFEAVAKAGRAVAEDLITLQSPAP